MITAWIFLSTCGQVYSHEISPSVSDIEIKGNTVTLEIQLNLESFVARIDLQSLDNTDNTEQANDYDLYRACLLYTSPSPRDRTRSRMPSSA